MQEQHWYVDVVRAFFGMLDRIIYGLIGTAYDLVAEIAHYKVFDSVDELTERIYAMLAIFMLFKVSFSFINYLINPDSFTDKEKGVQHVIKNIVIMFVMLVACPWAFKTMWDLQADILDENVIGRLVLADTKDVVVGTTGFKYNKYCQSQSNAKSNGEYIAIMTLRGFYQIHTMDDFRKIDASFSTRDYNQLLNSVCTAKETDDLLVSSLYNSENGEWFSDDYYFIDYKWGISTAVGVVVLLILVSFAMDVGLRVVKLSFLELLAPIPIVSYIDPSSAKNGMFKKWLKEVGTTWASLFIRLLALFFAVTVIQKVGELQYVGSRIPNPNFEFWVHLFVIIGALMFAKQLPKLIQNITGINLDGGFTLNPMKKIRDNALGGKVIGSIPGAALGGIGGAIAGGKAGAEAGAFGRGAFLGAISGASNGLKNNKGAFSRSMREEYKNLTGNEMARLSMGKMLLSGQGKKKVTEVKDNLGEAYGVLNTAQTDLNTAQTVTSHIGTELKNRGYNNLENIESLRSEMTQRHQIAVSRVHEAQNIVDVKTQEYQTTITQVDAEREKYENAKALVSQPHSGLVGADGRPIYSQAYNEAQRVIQKFEENGNAYLNSLDLKQREATEALQAANNDLSARRQEEHAINNDLESLTAYETSKQRESDLRQVISSLNKSIDTMKKEKTQRETFYHVDSASRDDYSKAVDKVREIKNRNNGQQ